MCCCGTERERERKKESEIPKLCSITIDICWGIGVESAGPLGSGCHPQAAGWVVSVPCAA